MPKIHTVQEDAGRGGIGSVIDCSPDLASARFCAPNVTTTYVTNADAGSVLMSGSGLTDAYFTQIDGGSDDGQVVNSAGGRLILTTNDADNDAIHLGFWGPTATATGGLPFLPVAATTIHFGMKCKLNDVDTVDFMCGLGVVDTDPYTMTDGVYFRKLGATEEPSIVLEKNSTETSTAMATALVDDTYFEIGFTVTALTNVDAFLDSEVKAASAVTNIDDDEPLCPFLSIRNFSAAASTLTIERFSCYQTQA